MNSLSPQQWMLEQRRLGHSLCLMLDSANELHTRQLLLDTQDPQQYCSLYSETPIADLASAGPFLFLVDNPADGRMDALLHAPERNWGWLASVTCEAGLHELARHWRQRLLVGTRPHQALYRFHDNRVLARALEFMAADAVPDYLGPALGVCYWQGQHWQCLANPAPGNPAAPHNPAWCNVPNENEQSSRIRAVNARRYLLAEHLEAYAQLSERQNPDEWLDAQLSVADSWGWQTAEHLQFLLSQRLNTRTYNVNLEPRPEETPAAHFQRVYDEVQFWTRDMPV